MTISELKNHVNNQNRLFLLISALLLIMLFCSGDDLIGMGRLHEVYTNLSIAVAGILIAGIPALLIVWHDIPWWAGVPWIIFILLLSVGLIELGFITTFLAVLVSVPITLFISDTVWAVIFVIAFGVVLFVWFDVARSHYQFSIRALKTTAFGLMLFAALFIFGIGASPKYSFDMAVDDLAFSTDHYYLYANWGWLGDPDRLALYRCNRFGFFCVKIYESVDYYASKEIKLATDAKIEALLVQINYGTLYAYRP
jgi:hypothetical protein